MTREAAGAGAAAAGAGAGGGGGGGGRGGGGGCVGCTTHTNRRALTHRQAGRPRDGDSRRVRTTRAQGHVSRQHKRRHTSSMAEQRGCIVRRDLASPDGFRCPLALPQLCAACRLYTAIDYCMSTRAAGQRIRCTLTVATPRPPPHWASASGRGTRHTRCHRRRASPTPAATSPWCWTASTTSSRRRRT